MVNYREAIKRPFTDLKKSGLAFLFNIIPVVNFLSFGYILECAKTSNKKELPEWDNYKEKFVKGFLFLIIWLVYAIPLIIVISIMFVKVAADIFSMSQLQNIANTGNVFGIISTMINIFLSSGMIALLVVAIILGILTSYLVPMALVNYSADYRFKDAFNFSDVFRKAFTKKYFAVWLVVQLYIVITSSILGLLPFIGGVIATTLIGITGYTMYGSVYKEIKV